MSTLSVSSAPAAWPEPPSAPPATMSAIVLDRFGPPEVLQVATVERPTPGPGEVLVRVAAVSVGRFLDVTLRAGRTRFVPRRRCAHRTMDARHLPCGQR